MSLKFQIRQWEVEMTWEQMTLTPLGTTQSTNGTMPENKTGITKTTNTNYFLFDLIEQLFVPTYQQEHLSK